MTVHDRHPLVEDVFERCGPPTQELRNLRGPPVATDLFVVAKSEVDRPLRLETPSQVHLDGFHDAHQAELVVQRASAPHEPVGDAPFEWRLLPACQGLGSTGTTS